MSNIRQAYPLNHLICNFGEGRQKGRGCQQGNAFSVGGGGGLRHCYDYEAVSAQADYNYLEYPTGEGLCPKLK